MLSLLAKVECGTCSGMSFIDRGRFLFTFTSFSYITNAVLIPIKWDHSRRKLCFSFFFSLTNLNLCVNSITRIFKIHIRPRPGTQRKSRVEAKYSPGPAPVPRKMVKFNPGLNQILSKVFLSKNRRLEFTKCC